jgi:NADH:ubiquinone oxidoreductase subunit F (NADH-binding)
VSAILDRRAPDAVPAAAWGQARLLAGTGGGRLDLAQHRQVHGVPRTLDATRLARALEAVGLLGRGGAAFPVATKLRAVARGRRTHVLVNGAEGEPASHKDRVLMRLAPHLVLDGALAAAAALETPWVTVAVQDGESLASLASALRERTDARTVRLVRHDHGFVGGEIRAVARGVSGEPPVPPGRRVLPTVHGVEGRPTFASNVETFAHIALLLALGVDTYAAIGATDEPGTTLVTLLGDVPHRELTVSRPSLRAAGAPLNASVLARLPRETCALGEVSTVAHWLAQESSGQCGPCFFGLPAVATTLDRLAVGQHVLPDALRRTGLLPGRGACAHPDGAATFVGSALAVLTDEIATHQYQGHCGRPLLGALPTGGTR